MAITRNSALLALLVFIGCDDDRARVSDTQQPDVAADVTPDVAPDSEPAEVEPEVEVTTEACADARVWSTGPYGVRRGDTAAEFEVPLTDGTSWNYRTEFGCDVVVVIPDRVLVSAIDQISVWDDDGGLDDLLERSPRDVVYLFVSNDPDASAAAAHVTAMRARLDALLARADADHWRPRLLVAATRAQDMEGWMGSMLTGHLRTGIALDRDQRIHGLGSLADVGRFDQRLQAQDQWPWKGNIGNAAYEAVYLQAEGIRQAALDAESAAIVTLWDGALLAELADTTVELPSAAVMAGFDTVEIEIVSRCPDPDQIELGNCGAWDYLANFYLREGTAEAPVYVELARAITSYHRETRWIIDASGLLPKLAAGGAQSFRWSFAPSWNTQPTLTTVRLRLSNRARGIRPVRVTPLFTGGGFGSAYNTGRVPAVVPIAAGTKKVELWAIITGHGAGTSQCAEFCPHQHHFTVNGVTHLREFPEASSQEGCVAQASAGMVPNQGGTWWFGRGGWCPGQAVAPWIVDVTADVGVEATIVYRGTLVGQEPPDGAGDIVMSSYLVEYE